MWIQTSKVFQPELYMLVTIGFSIPNSFKELTLALSKLVDILTFYGYVFIQKCDKEAMATYSSIMLKTIGKISKAVTNYHLFSLNNTIRSKVITLGIREQRNSEPYRRSMEGRSFFHRIDTIEGQQNDHLNYVA